MCINVWGHVVWIISCTTVCYVTHLSWLFTIIESFQHSSIGASLWKYEVVLEYAVLAANLSTIDWANYFWSIILKILHESGLGVVHDILRRLSLLVWVVESWCSGVGSSAEATLIHLILFIHKNYTVILLVTRIGCLKATVYCTSNRASTIRELTSSLFIRLVEGISSTISSRFSSTTYSCMISTCSIAISTIIVAIGLSKCTNIHGSIHGIHICKIAGATLDWSFSVMINIDSGIHVLIISISIYRHAVLMLLMNRIAGTTISSLLPKFSLCNCFGNLSVSTIWILTWWIHALKHIIIVLGRIEELLGGHHHLLLMVLASIRSFPLVDQIEKVGLIILWNTVSSSNSVASHSTWVDTKWACSIPIACIGNVLMIHIFKWLTSVMLLGIEIVHSLLSSIALSNVLHEVSIIHCVSHLCLIMSTLIWILWVGKSTYSGLIEHLLFLVHLAIYMRQHLMNSWIICWLK